MCTKSDASWTKRTLVEMGKAICGVEWRDPRCSMGGDMRFARAGESDQGPGDRQASRLRASTCPPSPSSYLPGGSSTWLLRFLPTKSTPTSLRERRGPASVSGRVLGTPPPLPGYHLSHVVPGGAYLKFTTWTQFNLETPNFQPVMPKNLS